MVNFGKPQKALHLHLEEDKKKPKHQGYEYCVMEKFDGWYMYVDLIDDEWQGIRSKTGRELPSMAEYNKLLEDLPIPAANCRFIFEAVIPQKDGPRGYMEFKDCNGLFNQKKQALDNVVIKMHDVLIEGRPNATFEDRYNTLSLMFKHWAKTDHVGDWLHLVPILQRTHSKYDWMEHYNEIVSDRGEGVILKRSKGIYESDKRNFNLMKIKCELTLDLEVVGVVEGEGKYAGTLGNLIVKDKAGILNNVSGMSDEQRDLWWGNPSLIKGKIVEVKAMKKLSNGSLREGRFKAVRHDKTIEDID